MKTGSNKKLKYEKMVKKTSPKPKLGINCIKAFFVGGAICTFGEGLIHLYGYLGASEADAATLTSITLIFLGALLTGLDLYDPIGNFAGAGSVIPITGFANSKINKA